MPDGLTYRLADTNVARLPHQVRWRRDRQRLEADCITEPRALVLGCRRHAADGLGGKPPTSLT